MNNAAEQKDYVLNPKTIVTDFELAAMNAYKFHWPGAELKGCFLHYTQSILRWAFRNGYKLHYTINTKFNTWIRMVLSLPVIPVHHIQDAWNVIVNDLPIDINVRPIIESLKKIWLNG